jgi:hypothetical protein
VNNDNEKALVSYKSLEAEKKGNLEARISNYIGGSGNFLRISFLKISSIYQLCTNLPSKAALIERSLPEFLGPICLNDLNQNFYVNRRSLPSNSA